MLNGNRAVTVDQFGGLRVDMDPSEAGWGNAIDLLNVDFDRYGRVHSRMGTEVYTAAPAAVPYVTFFSFRGNGTADRLLASGTGLTDALGTTGTVVATTNAGPFNSCAVVGTASQTECYIAYSTAASMRVYNGTSMAIPTATTDGVAGGVMPQVECLGVTPWDNRLAAANSPSSTGGPSTKPSSPYHVYFSQPGNPQTWDSTDYEILNPGDGEPITALVMWREYLFAFKRSKFYVFYGTSTDSTGGAIFNYREVRAGVGVNQKWQVCAARDGVYFADATGVYRTTGGEPQPVSQAIGPVFAGTAAAPASFFTGPTDVTIAGLAVHDNRVYVLVNIGQVFVYDINTGMWTYWTIPGLAFQGGVAPSAAQMVAHTFGFARSQMYFGLTSSNNIARFNKAATTDLSVNAINALYRSGFATPAGAGSEATVRETLGEGAGNVLLSWSRDYTSTFASESLLAMGFQGRVPHRKAYAGENLSYKLRNNDASPWQINRLTPFVREARGAAEVTR